MAAIGTAFVRVKPDMDGFEREATTGIGGAAKKAAAAFVAVFAAAKIGGFLKGAIEEASDLNENMTKTEAIFGAASDAVVDFAGKGAKALGQSRNEVINAAATFGTFGKAAGLGGQELADFSTGFVSLSTDLASFSNTSPEEAVQAIGSALRGEAEPMRRYGVLLDDASLRQEALRQGLIKTTKEALTPQQKILAAQALIYKQTGDAQGDFAKTSGGLANQQRILAAQWTDMKGRIGAGLLPIMVKLASFATGTLLPGIERLGGFLADKLGPVFTMVKDAAGRVIDILFKGDFTGGPFAEDSKLVDVLFRMRDAFLALSDYVRANVVPAMQAVGGFIAAEVVPRLAQVADYVRANFLPVLQRVGDFLSQNLQPIFAGLGASLGTYLLPIVGALTGALGGALVGALVGIVSALASPIVLIGALTAALVYAFQNSERFREIVLTVATFLREKLVTAFHAVSEFVTSTAVPAIQRIADFVVNGLFPALRTVAGFLVETFTPTFRAMADFFTGTAVPAIQGLLAKVRENLPAFLGFAQVVGTVIAVVAALVAKVVGFLLPILLNLAGFLTRTLFTAIGAVIDALGGIIRAFQSAWEAAQTVARIVGEAFEKVRTGVEVAKTMAGLFWDKIKEIKVPQPLKDIAELIGKIAGGLKGAAETGLGWLKNIPGVGDGPGAPRGGTVGGPMVARVKSMIAGTGASITSTYRDPARNRAAGGSPTSYHLDRSNPAVDIVGPAALLDRLYAQFQSQGGYRELLWRVKGHYDHLHVAHNGGMVSPSWPTLPGLRGDERPAILQTGERVQSRAELAMAGGGRMHPDDIEALAAAMVRGASAITLEAANAASRTGQQGRSVL